MAWTWLIIAGLLEIVWAYFMKQSDGFTRLWPSVATLAFMGASFGLLALAMKSLPMGSAYMVWTGIGAVGAFVAGIVMFGEDMNAMRVIAAGLIVSGLVLMKIASPA
jgi:quaternary ammonium compound-resistance protein SugE